MPDTATDAARENANGWLTWIVIPSAFLGSLVTLTFIAGGGRPKPDPGIRTSGSSQPPPRS